MTQFKSRDVDGRFDFCKRVDVLRNSRRAQKALWNGNRTHRGELK